MEGMIPYGRQDIDSADIDAVVRVLKSEFVTQGPEIPAFEKKLTELTGAAHAVAVCNATAALHLACLAAGLGKGGLLWTSPISFVASSNCALYCGADVDFVDIDPSTYNMSVPMLGKKLEQAKKAGRLPQVVIPVHLAGQSCDMKGVRALADRYGFKVIEDASHAVGGSYGGRRVGSCEYSDLAVFSFHPVKIVTTGEGGAVLTHSPELARKVALLRSHGITRDSALMTHEPDGAWYYQQLELGFNYRITDLQAVLGQSQLRRIDEFVARRREVRDRYDRELARLPLTLPMQAPETESAWHLYVVRLRRDLVRKSHREVFDAIRAKNIGVNLHYIPIYLQPYYQALGFKKGHCPEAERYYAEAISLPMYSALAPSDQDRVIQALNGALAER